ncbi:MAG TPA: AzlC family ABC transporter permease [Burkholderiales bacterium]|nr:AzlC family ABC transporter permease [Burkholderiales bacterium]
MSQAAFTRGMREAASIPAATLAAGYLGFGALAAGHGIPVAGAALSTVVIWALPGQLILLEMHAAGAPLIAVVLSVALSSARFLPMTATLMPMLRHERYHDWHYYGAAQLLAMTGWSMALLRFPEMPRSERLPWLTGFAAVCCAASAAATAMGYVVADQLTPLAMLGLAFLAPMYYLLILLGGVRERLVALSIAVGAVAGPLALLAWPDWSLLACGLGGGTLAWALDRGLRRA